MFLAVYLGVGWVGRWAAAITSWHLHTYLMLGQLKFLSTSTSTSRHGKYIQNIIILYYITWCYVIKNFGQLCHKVRDRKVSYAELGPKKIAKSFSRVARTHSSETLTALLSSFLWWQFSNPKKRTIFSKSTNDAGWTLDVAPSLEALGAPCFSHFLTIFSRFFTMFHYVAQYITIFPIWSYLFTMFSQCFTIFIHFSAFLPGCFMFFHHFSGHLGLWHHHLRRRGGLHCAWLLAPLGQRTNRSTAHATSHQSDAQVNMRIVLIDILYIYITGWWFGTFFIFHNRLGIIIPTD